MDILWYGDTIQTDSWDVIEDTGCGFMRIYHILSGTIKYTDSQSEFELKKDTICFFPTNTPYKITCDKPADFHCVWLHIGIFSHTLDKTLIIDNSYSPIYQKCFSLIRTIIRNNDKEMLSLSANILLKQVISDNLLKSLDPNFNKIMIALENEALTPVEIKDFAREHGYSCEHLSRLFKKNINITPYQFVINIRMSYALEYLKGDHTITSIAEAIGYTDLKSFNKAFKLKYSMSATEYKQLYFSREIE